MSNCYTDLDEEEEMKENLLQLGISKAVDKLSEGEEIK